MPLTKDDLLQIRLIVKEEVSDIRVNVGSLNKSVGRLDTRVGSLESKMGSVENRLGSVESNQLLLNSKVDSLEAGSNTIMGLIRTQGERLERVEENTAVSRRILERNELSEKSNHGKRLLRVESRIHRIGVVATSGK